MSPETSQQPSRADAMTDPFRWSLGLGRWGGTSIRVHPILLIFAAFELLDASMSKERTVGEAGGMLLMLLAALAVHELGHALMAARLGQDHDEVRLWPLGSLPSFGPGGVARGPEGLWVAAAGPAFSLAAAVGTAIGLHMAGAQMVFNPFGHDKTGGAPFLHGTGLVVSTFTPRWWIGWFGYLNWVLCLVNLIPALPMDCGRFLRGLLAGPWGQPRESLIATYSAHASAVVLGIAGVFRLFGGNPGALLLIGLAVLIEIMVRAEARMMEEGGFYDDTLFGYDFSQGYTSLEAGAPKVRPYRESALKRWRRKRSDLRRQRRDAKLLAQGRRMDEILEKLHREGRQALTDEEQRFLNRVSAELRGRAKSRG